MNRKSFITYLATGEYAPTMDADPVEGGASVDLQAHDRRFHPNGYKDGDHCQYREERNLTAESDKVDKVPFAASATEKYLAAVEKDAKASLPS